MCLAWVWEWLSACGTMKIELSLLILLLAYQRQNELSIIGQCEISVCALDYKYLFVSINEIQEGVWKSYA